MPKKASIKQHQESVIAETRKRLEAYRREIADIMKTDKEMMASAMLGAEEAVEAVKWSKEAMETVTKALQDALDVATNLCGRFPCYRDGLYVLSRDVYEEAKAAHNHLCDRRDFLQRFGMCMKAGCVTFGEDHMTSHPLLHPSRNGRCFVFRCALGSFVFRIDHTDAPPVKVVLCPYNCVVCTRKVDSGSKSRCQCYVFRYCSDDCHRAHWTGGHAEVCVPYTSRSTHHSPLRTKVLDLVSKELLARNWAASISEFDAEQAGVLV